MAKRSAKDTANRFAVTAVPITTPGMKTIDADASAWVDPDAMCSYSSLSLRTGEYVRVYPPAHAHKEQVAELVRLLRTAGCHVRMMPRAASTAPLPQRASPTAQGSLRATVEVMLGEVRGVELEALARVCNAVMDAEGL